MPIYDDKWLFYEKAGGRCEWCGKKLTWKNRGRKGRGAWEIHHHPPKSGMSRTFRGVISPDIIMFLRVLCWECHRKTLGSNFPDVIDYLR
jgi:hypothetical protein